MHYKFVRKFICVVWWWSWSKLSFDREWKLLGWWVWWQTEIFMVVRDVLGISKRKSGIFLLVNPLNAAVQFSKYFFFMVRNNISWETSMIGDIFGLKNRPWNRRGTLGLAWSWQSTIHDSNSCDLKNRYSLPRSWEYLYTSRWPAQWRRNNYLTIMH